MLASIFVIQGFDNLRRPERVAAEAEPVARLIAERVPVLSGKPEQAVRINGAVQVAAGTLLALGRWPRLSALAIAATLVPTTLAGHRFWEAEDKEDQASQRVHFLKNVSMFGGLLIAAADTAGSPSIAWRTQVFSLCMLSMRTAVSGECSMIFRVASRPLILGRAQSITMT